MCMYVIAIHPTIVHPSVLCPSICFMLSISPSYLAIISVHVFEAIILCGVVLCCGVYVCVCAWKLTIVAYPFCSWWQELKKDLVRWHEAMSNQSRAYFIFLTAIWSVAFIQNRMNFKTRNRNTLLLFCSPRTDPRLSHYLGWHRFLLHQLFT